MVENAVMEENTEREKFEITDMASAEWALERIAEKRKKQEEVKADYHKMVEKYDKWLKDSIEALDSDILYLEGLLRPWLESELEGTKKKSVKLPSGKVGFKAGAQTWTMGGEKVNKDNPQLIAYASVNAKDFIKEKTVTSVDWAGMKKQLHVMEDGRVVTPDGEIIEGMTCTTGTPTLYTEV